MAVGEYLDSGSNLLGTGGLVGLAYGAVRLYRRLMNDSDAAWDKRMVELREERDKDRAAWEEDRREWQSAMAALTEKSERDIAALTVKSDRCHEENADLRAQIGRLEGQVAGLQYQVRMLEAKG